MAFSNMLFNENYFKAKQFEKSGKIYERIGIKIYKRMIMHLTMRKKIGNYNLMNYSVDELKYFEKITRYNEKYHVIAFFFTLFFILIISFFSNSIIGNFCILICILCNIFGNFYPICLQRYNRIRINKVLSKLKTYRFYQRP